jgi:hypothetical protein
LDGVCIKKVFVKGPGLAPRWFAAHMNPCSLGKRSSVPDI